MVLNPGNPSLPNIIFCNLPNAGSSALDPIFKEMLAQCGYIFTPFGPEASNRLVAFINKQAPFYHWTHDPIETFDDFNVLENPHYRFIYLHRDLRDVAVSVAKDLILRNMRPAGTEQAIIAELLQKYLPSIANNAEKWIAFSACQPNQCICLRYDDVKSDIKCCLKRVFSFLDISICDADLHASIAQHSFEIMTGRTRGVDGPIVRNCYFIRKGISGDWKNYFNDKLRKQFKASLGQYLIDYGWAVDNTW
ncbi:MAG: sulfotransferase domain-containing protein [Gammaproteobacteria bacterium]|nr:sulfotransferase domain-containing protein [Gammaproteobacteria bacterium]